MSDDLISRKALLQILYGDEEFLQRALKEHYKNAYMSPELVVDRIESVPTAYDVDKVIEQLEENAKYFQSEADELAQKGDWGTATDLQGRATAYRDSAEIVKSGGVAND